MSIESELFTLLKDIAAIKAGSISRVYPRVTPDNATFPLIIYQVVGGQAYDYLERKLPDCEHYRVQISCWSKDADTTRALALAVREKVVEDGTAFAAAETLGQAVDDYEDAQKIYGSRQDFGVWLKVR
ncbi:DUF3168 domain-containing protein [Castellaniella ginsengisoli]|uniref:DUF3168 domain-containing protein n=1 Tax=Castellaniella ginsengisoli TaxID=546114 RepID=A0AB39ERS1_9BURK